MTSKAWEQGAVVKSIRQDGQHWVPLDVFMDATVEIARLQEEVARLHKRAYLTIPLPRWWPSGRGC